MSANQLALWYLVASVSFILALKGLSGPRTARRGNAYGMIGMAIALMVTLALVYSRSRNVAPILGGLYPVGRRATPPVLASNPVNMLMGTLLEDILCDR